MERDDAASPTAMTESILITATIDAKQKRDVMTADIPNAFVQTDVDEKNQVKGDRIIMKIRGPLVDMLLEVNTRSSTEAELVGFDDVVSKILWSKLFIEAQDFEVKANIVYRDNTSSMRLEENGKASSGKHTRHFHIKFFYITDLINRNEIHIKYCPTEDMIADYMTKATSHWCQIRTFSQPEPHYEPSI
jgi:hypothetical protein